MKDEEKSVMAIIAENIPNHNTNLQSLSAKIYAAIRHKVKKSVEDEIGKSERSAKELEAQAYQLRNQAFVVKQEAHLERLHNGIELDKVISEYLKIKDTAKALHEELLNPQTSQERIAYIQGFLSCYMSVKHEDLDFKNLVSKDYIKGLYNLNKS